MLELDLLRSFVSVVDAGGFTRAGERVHRTQSTVSQQIRRLEEDFGRPLLHRDGKRIRPTEEGERLLSYARRILALAEEARDVVSRPSGDGVVRLGLPEDFAAHRLPEMLSEFARSRPGLRLYVRCGKSDRMRRALERGEIDVALFKRDAEETGGIAACASGCTGSPAAVARSISVATRCRSPYSSKDAFTAIGRSTRSRWWVAPGTSPTRAPVF
jgi:DNA-binding transcriptional LysR family regulator